MHFFNTDRDVHVYLCPECEIPFQSVQETLRPYAEFCQTREQADVLVCDHVPQDYDVTSDVPLLCLCTEEKSDACYKVRQDDAHKMAEYFAVAAPDASVRAQLCGDATFAVVCSANVQQAMVRLCGMIAGEERLWRVGVTDMEHAQEGRVCVLVADAMTLQDEALRAFCNTAQMPVVAITLDDVTQEQVREFCADVRAVSPAYDIWKTNDMLCDAMGLQKSEDDEVCAGLMMLYGIGRPRSVKDGMRLLKRSAQMGNVRALLHLSLCKRYAVGCRQDRAGVGRLLAQASQRLLDPNKEHDDAGICSLAYLTQELCSRYNARGDLQRARTITVQAQRISADYLQKQNSLAAMEACADCALLAADYAFAVQDTDAYVAAYLQYARLAFDAAMHRKEKIDADVCDEVLSTLDTIVQWLLGQDNRMEDVLSCVDIGVMWQQYVMQERDDVACRAALASYLDLRGELQMHVSPKTAVRDYETCIALCSDYACQDNRAARFLAKCRLALADALYCDQQYVQACEAYETAYTLWCELYDYAADADAARGVCTALYKRAQAAAAACREDAAMICDEAIARCAEFADTFRASSIWKALAQCYGVRAKVETLPLQSAEFYKKQASIWHQLHVLTYEADYQKKEKDALIQAKACQKESGQTGWKRIFGKKRAVQMQEASLPQEQEVQSDIEQEEVPDALSGQDEEVLSVTDENAEETAENAEQSAPEVEEASEEQTAEDPAWDVQEE